MRFRFAIILCFITLTSQVHGQTPDRPVRTARYPALSPDGTRLCIVYQGNLWSVASSGGVATRLTAADCTDAHPVWSADGKWIAFNSDREGGNQVFIIPSEGGIARQLTFHSIPTTVGDWFPDGKSMLVTTARDTRKEALCRLDVKTGKLTLLLKDEVKALFPTVSPDGTMIVWTRGALSDIIRKGYKGAASYHVWVMPTDGSGPPRKITRGDTNHMWPVWGTGGKLIHFVSEEPGPGAILSHTPMGPGYVAMLHNHPPDAIRFLNASRNGLRVTFECDNRIWVTDTANRKTTEVPIICRTDARGPRATHAVFSKTGVEEFAIAPDGKRVALVVRGDVWLINSEKGGDARRVTNSPTHERYLAWSPDGKELAYASHRDGKFQIMVTRPEKPDPRKVAEGVNEVAMPRWSPDGKWIALLRIPEKAIYVVRADGTGEQRVALGPSIEEFNWSPDGRWIAYQKENALRTNDIWAVHLTFSANTVSVEPALNITHHPGYNTLPQWLPNGEKLFFLTNRYRNRDIETLNDQGRYALYSVPLQREKSKFDEDEAFGPPAVKPAADAKPTASPPTKPINTIAIDPIEIERRAKSIVAMDGSIRTFATSPDGKSVAFVMTSAGISEIWTVGIDGGTIKKVATGAPKSLAWSPDSSRIYFVQAGALNWVNKTDASAGDVPFVVRMDVDRLEDYLSTFDEIWLTLSERFYDPKFHGVNWVGMKDKYRPLVSEVTTRSDFAYLVLKLLGELNASHLGYTHPSMSKPTPPTGTLGIIAESSYTGNGVRVSRVVARTPASFAESRLSPGDAITAVNDMPVTAGSQWDRSMTDTVDHTVALSVTDSSGKARVVRIKPISPLAYRALLYEEWLDQRRALVQRLSNGTLGYLHVNDMGDDSRNRFERELFDQAPSVKGMVLDFRDNNGGDTHDSLLRVLERTRPYFRFIPRQDAPFLQPERAWTKPTILLTNAGSLSDAEVFSNGYKELKLGKVVGTPTMGWIIFTSSATMMDGSIIRVPGYGCYTLDGRDMENWGVPPDILVDNLPEDVASGIDKQIERAVSELMKSTANGKL